MQDKKSSVGGKKNPPPRPLGMVIKVMPQPKKAKVETTDCKEPEKATNITGLVSYSDDSDNDDD